MHREPTTAILEPRVEPGAPNVRPLYADAPDPVRAEAVRRLATRIETLPDSPWVEVWQAQRDLFELRDRAAIGRLFRALRSGPADVKESACHELAQLYRHRGEHRRALSFYERAAAEGGGTAAALVARAETHVELGERQAAEGLFREAVAILEPSEAPIAVAAGDGLARLLASDGRVDDARALLADLFRRFPFRTELRRLRKELAGR